MHLVTHDAEKFFHLLLKRNGYVLEQVLSPLVVKTTPVHDALREIAPRCVTRHHAHHYLGFAAHQWRLFEKEHPRRIKPLLYVFRALLTGIHLMQSGVVEASLVRLNERHALPYVPELIARKVHGTERQTIDDADMSFFESEYRRWLQVLEMEVERTALPGETKARGELHEMLLRLRASEGVF